MTSQEASIEVKYQMRCVLLRGGLLDGLAACLPRDAGGEIYVHRLPDGRVFEYELLPENIGQFLGEVKNGVNI